MMHASINTTMPELLPVTMTDLSATLWHFAFRRRRPVMIWGPPGVGKSKGVEQFADHLRTVLDTPVTMVDVRLGQYDSVDLRGVPDVDREARSTTWYAPATLPFKGNPKFEGLTGWIILFLDEINGANHATSGAAYQLIQDRRIGEHELMDNVIIIAAGNREGDRGVTSRQPAPLSNRFLHLEVRPDFVATANYILDQGLPPEGAAWLHFKNDMVYTFDPTANEKAFATPRSIEEALKTYVDPDIPMHLKEIGMAGEVGIGWSSGFLAFTAVYDDMKNLMPAIFRDPANARLPTQLDQLYSVAVNLGGQMTRGNADDLWPYVSRMGGDFAVLTFTLAMRRDPDIDQTNAFMEFAKKYKAVFQPAAR